jgi:hypothetical protein
LAHHIDKQIERATFRVDESSLRVDKLFSDLLKGRQGLLDTAIAAFKGT